MRTLLKNIYKFKYCRSLCHRQSFKQGSDSFPSNERIYRINLYWLQNCNQLHPAEYWRIYEDWKGLCVNKDKPIDCHALNYMSRT